MVLFFKNGSFTHLKTLQEPPKVSSKSVLKDVGLLGDPRLSTHVMLQTSAPSAK